MSFGLRTAVLLSCAALASMQGWAAPSCSGLRSLTLPNARITFAALSQPGGMLGPGNIPIDKIPAFCRVGGVIRPSKDSNIRFEVWLPTEVWNGKFRAAGNGGFAGSINYADMAAALRDGFATASTDTGHSGNGVEAGWALGHPEKVVDFGYRSIHEMTVKAKAIIEAFYGSAPRKSFFASCSNGGREGLMEAQRYPEDYDGILAGAPANFWTHLTSVNFFNSAVPVMKDAKAYIAPSKVPAITSAVLAACDALDGLKDGLISDPTKCHFDPAALLCKGAESDSCLTAPQVKELGRIYDGARDAQGKQIYPGYEFGGEDGPGGWPLWLLGPAPGQSLGVAFSLGFMRDLLYQNAAWDPLTASLEPALQAADEKMAPVLNATDPNLKPFQSHGGKLILYHGWSDPGIPPLNAVNYYDSIAASMGQEQTDAFARLYMVPGMQHCGYGPGPNLFGQVGVFKMGDPQHDVFSALDEWVEKGTAPAGVIATKYTEDDPAKGAAMTRPLCPYPQIAKYKGSGDSKDAANFSCATP